MQRAIGVIDSGIGGLTVVQELLHQLPNERIIYLGDTARCPYGPRTQEEIKTYTREMANFMINQDIKMLIIACNTATAFTLEDLQNELSIPVLGVIQPGARAAIKAARTDYVSVIGTQGTIASGAYADALRMIKPFINVYQLACPQFVPLVETGMLTGPNTEEVIRSSLQPLKVNAPTNTLVLGCTHYPLLKQTIQKVMGPEVSIISSSEETARETSVLLSLNNMLNNNRKPIQHEFYTTGDPDTFAELVHVIFESTENRMPVIPTIKQVSID